MADVLTAPSSTITPVETPERDDDAMDYSGWYCIRTASFPCPREGCGFVAAHLTAAHLILVWPEMDDRALLTAARDARDVGRKPEVVEYEPAMGPAISYGQWVASGRPVHGSQPLPDGWEERWKRL